MFINYLSENPRFFFAVVITMIISIVLHELAHGFAAVKLGDRTPILMNRMTLNPVVHMGVSSLIFLVLAGIAWGAMPVDRSRLRGKYAEAIVAFAGPWTNFCLGVMASLGLGFWHRAAGGVADEGAVGNLEYLLQIFALANFALAMFNMIPWPPLDGSGILSNLSPGYRSFLIKVEQSGAGIMGFLVLFFIAGRLIWPAASELRQVFFNIAS